MRKEIWSLKLHVTFGGGDGFDDGGNVSGVGSSGGDGFDDGFGGGDGGGGDGGSGDGVLFCCT